MNRQAPLREPPVEQALAIPQKNVPKTSPVPLTALSSARNAAVGMALTYVERLDSIRRPLALSARNSGLYLAALLHISMPLLATWFATHWSERVEGVMWGGSAIANAASFGAAWLIMLFIWSMLWLALRAVSLGLFFAIGSLRARGGARRPPTRALPGGARRRP